MKKIIFLCLVLNGCYVYQYPSSCACPPSRPAYAEAPAYAPSYVANPVYTPSYTTSPAYTPVSVKSPIYAPTLPPAPKVIKRTVERTVQIIPASKLKEVLK
jgi:hypothetical protein